MSTEANTSGADVTTEKSKGQQGDPAAKTPAAGQGDSADKFKQEAIDRRLKNKELKRQVSDLQGQVKDFEGLSTKLSEMEGTLKTEREARLKAERIAIAAKHGLPDSLADRLKGATAEELEADAKVLAAALPAKPAAGTPAPGAPPAKTTSTANPGAVPTLTVEEIRLMPRSEIRKRWAEVKTVLQAAGKPAP